MHGGGQGQNLIMGGGRVFYGSDIFYGGGHGVLWVHGNTADKNLYASPPQAEIFFFSSKMGGVRNLYVFIRKQKVGGGIENRERIYT